MRIIAAAPLVELDDVALGACVRWKGDRLCMVVRSTALDNGRNCLAALDSGQIYTPNPDRMVEVLDAAVTVSK